MSERPAYDDIEAIACDYLEDGLDGLNRLARDRMEAGYKRKEHLQDFIIMGRWHADTCGNFSRCEFRVGAALDGDRPLELPERLPRDLWVMTKDEAFARIARVSLTSFMTSDIPPSTHIICPECKNGWTLETAHDVFVAREDRVVPLTPGKTIAEREKDWEGASEGAFRFGPDPSVRNPKFIDLTPDPERSNHVINEKGWRYHHPPFNHEHLTRDYVAEEGDECSLTVFLYYHKRCWKLRKASTEREEFTEIFSKAKAVPATLNEIPNEYCPCIVCGPWFIASFPFGDIKIGWRKRVINIDWSTCKRDLSDLFKDENVTKGAGFIHAWGDEKAAEYMQRIHAALSS